MRGKRDETVNSKQPGSIKQDSDTEENAKTVCCYQQRSQMIAPERLTIVAIKKRRQGRKTNVASAIQATRNKLLRPPRLSQTPCAEPFGKAPPADSTHSLDGWMGMQGQSLGGRRPSTSLDRPDRRAHRIGAKD